jgi:hypothetical protein
MYLAVYCNPNVVRVLAKKYSWTRGCFRLLQVALVCFELLRFAYFIGKHKDKKSFVRGLFLFDSCLILVWFLFGSCLILV